MLYFQQVNANMPTICSQLGIPYLSISVSLNILLTLMIVIRLALHGRNIHTATGSPVGTSGVCKAVSTMFIESCALFTVSSLVVIGALFKSRKECGPDTHNPGRYTADIFFPILAETQVRAFP